MMYEIVIMPMSVGMQKRVLFQNVAEVERRGYFPREAMLEKGSNKEITDAKGCYIDPQIVYHVFHVLAMLNNTLIFTHYIK